MRILCIQKTAILRIFSLSTLKNIVLSYIIYDNIYSIILLLDVKDESWCLISLMRTTIEPFKSKNARYLIITDIFTEQPIGLYYT